MVRKMTDEGKGFYHEPPYTEKEEVISTAVLVVGRSLFCTPPSPQLRRPQNRRRHSRKNNT
jgi:hypothetical protein